MKKFLLSLITIVLWSMNVLADVMAFQVHDAAAPNTTSARTIVSVSSMAELKSGVTQSNVCTLTVADGSINNDGWIRWFSGKDMTITPAKDVTINSVKIHCGDKKSGEISIGVNNKLTVDCSNGKTADAEFSNLDATSKITIANSAQIRFSYVEIEYTAASSDPVTVKPTLTVTSEGKTFEDQKDYSITEGSTVEIVAKDAEKIQVSDNNGNIILTQSGTKATWTPTKGDYMPIITATNAIGETFISFHLVVKEAPKPIGNEYNFTVASISGSADPYTVKLNFSSNGTSTTFDGLTFEANKNNGSTSPQVNSSAKDLRLYAKATLTIHVPKGLTVSQLVFNISTQGLKRLAPITASVGKITTQASGDKTVTWTGSVTNGDITLTVGDKANYGSDGKNSAGQLCFTTGTMTASTSEVAQKEESGLSYSSSDAKIILGSEYTLPALSNPKNVEVTYSSSDVSIATVATNGEVTLANKIGTTTITAAPVDTAKYSGTASYILTVSTIYDSIEKLLELGNGESATVECPLTVVAIQGSYCYVIDNRGGHGLIYKKDLSYTPGDVIPAGWEVKMSIYNGLPELVPTSSAPAATGKAEVEIEVCEAADLEALMVNGVVYVNGVTFSAATPANSTAFTGVSDGVTINFYNSAKIASVEAGVYDVLLAASVFDTTVQYIPLAYTPSGVEPVVKEDIEEFEWSEAEVTVVEGEEYELPVFSCSDPEVEVVFASSNPGVADVEDGVIVLKGDFGTAEITATLSNHEVYNDAVAACTVKVKRAGVKTPQHTGTWRLVTNVNDLKDGEIYTLVGHKTVENEPKDYFMNYTATNKNNSNLKAIEFSRIADGKFTPSDEDKIAYVVLCKNGDDFAMYLTNAATPGFITCNSNTKDTPKPDGTTTTAGNSNEIKITEVADEVASYATITIAEDGAASVVYNGSLVNPLENTRVNFGFNKAKGNDMFSCYTQDNLASMYFYGVFTPAPQVNVVSGDEEEYEVELFTEMEGSEIWYRVMPYKGAAKGQSREAAEEGEEEVPYELAPSNNHHVVLSTDKRVDYYTVLYGRQSDWMSHSKAGGTTGIYEVKNVIEQMPTMWFDLQGRRVNAPAKGGVYILKQGAKVSKIRL